jgi:hypothetical protein
MINYILGVLIICGSCSSASAILIHGDNSKRLTVSISKSGLNRISNPPYQITQVTGDDSKYRLKHDEDGANIYLMPLVKVGEYIEVSVKNNIGDVQDLELKIDNIKGQVVIIDGSSAQNVQNLQRENITEMMQAMRQGRSGKFYLQKVKTPSYQFGSIQVRQNKLYKWKNLVGGVFEISNKTKSTQEFEFNSFLKSFQNVKTSFISKHKLLPKESGVIFVVQQLED